MKVKKITFSVLLSLLIMIIIVVMGLYILFKASLPNRDGEIQIGGINSTINILFDEKGIPQIWADTEEDAWFAVGWLHASDRLFQMELTRRVASGRLSELFGEMTLSFDRKQRLIGHHVIAQKDISNLNDRTKRFLEAYSAGVNQWVNHIAALPFEFQVLNARFEPWSVQDCLTIFSFQTWFIDDLQNNDDLFIFIEKNSGREKAREIISPYPKEAPKTVPQIDNNENGLSSHQAKYASLFRTNDFIYENLFAGGNIPFLMTNSSNSWTVSGSKSNSGNALFCSDPHLELSRLPQFWYIVGVHVRDKNLETLGITSPGIPLVAMGHNGKISWAFTAGGIDVTDEYIEQLNPENPNEYRVGDEFVPFEKRYEFIKVSGNDEVDTLEVKISRHGPVMSKSETPDHLVSLHWAGFDFSPSEGLSAGFQMLQSEDFAEFRESVTRFGAFNANWMYADREGNIGYQLGTPIPIRMEGAGHTRMIGWDNKSEWSGYYQLDKTPYAYNPSKGWLATCNNKPDETNIDYSLYGNFADERIRRITELLTRLGKLSVKDMKKFQNDRKSIGLIKWKDEAIKILDQLDYKDLVEMLDTWDGNSHLNSKETALLEIWIVLLKTYTFSDDFGDLTPKLLNKIFYRERDFYRIYIDNVESLFDDKRTNNMVESRDEMAKKAMEEAINLLGDRVWGEVQTLTMSHPLAAVPVLSSFLSLQRGPFPRAGVNGSLNNTTSFWNSDDFFVSKGGASWRFVLDFGDIDQAQIVLPAGQSGNPLSDHFFDFYDLWEKGAYWTVPFSREKVEERAVSNLKLSPVSD